jgi:hypothetical protein
VSTQVDNCFVGDPDFNPGNTEKNSHETIAASRPSLSRYRANLFTQSFTKGAEAGTDIQSAGIPIGPISFSSAAHFAPSLRAGRLPPALLHHIRPANRSRRHGFHRRKRQCLDDGAPTDHHWAICLDISPCAAALHGSQTPAKINRSKHRPFPFIHLNGDGRCRQQTMMP